MTTITVDELKVAIESLPKRDYSILRDWFAKNDWKKWDKQIKKNSKAGTLDFLVEEALQEKEQGLLRPL